MSLECNPGLSQRWRAPGQLLSVMAVWYGEVQGGTDAASHRGRLCVVCRLRCWPHARVRWWRTLAGASAGARAAAAAAVCSRCSSSKKLPTRSTSPCSYHKICNFTPADALPTGGCGTMAGNRQLLWRNQVHGADRHAWLDEARHQPIQQDMNMCSCCGAVWNTVD